MSWAHNRSTYISSRNRNNSETKEFYSEYCAILHKVIKEATASTVVCLMATVTTLWNIVNNLEYFRQIELYTLLTQVTIWSQTTFLPLTFSGTHTALTYCSWTVYQRVSKCDWRKHFDLVWRSYCLYCTPFVWLKCC